MQLSHASCGPFALWACFLSHPTGFLWAGTKLVQSFHKHILLSTVHRIWTLHQFFSCPFGQASARSQVCASRFLICKTHNDFDLSRCRMNELLCEVLC